MAKPSYDELLEVISQLQRLLAERDRRIAELERLVEELHRGGKRQAAPFSKGKPKKNPKRPGRKPGRDYGHQVVRSAPKRIDETIVVPCPLYCKLCEGPVRLRGKASQYQIDLPPIRPRTTRFVVHYGQCRHCGRRVQGRHPRQSSDALEVGRVQIGPGVVSWAAYLNKVGGLSYAKVTGVFEQMTGLKVARSTLCRALRRLARKAQPTYEALVETIRASPVVYPDETGWKVGGRKAWLWAFTNRKQTVYAIERGRGYDEAASILGEDYSGVIGADGWAPYRRFEHASMQTCLRHLLSRSRDMLETATRGAVRFPRKVKAILQDALRLRERRDTGKISPHGVRVATGRLRARMSRLISGRITNPDNLRFANHLSRYQQALFLFLERSDVEATNWPAEHAIRPAVVNRKSCGGNRTEKGARTQAILMSILRTCHQRGRSALAVFQKMLRDPVPRTHRLVPSARTNR
ncbi:MAG: IS66 family transposase [Acidobacteriota bacterium]